MRLNLIQGTPIWKAKRKECITSTDIGVIMGLNPYKTREQLMLQKLELEPEDEVNEKMLTGTKLESVARDIFVQKTSELVFPGVFIHEQYQWAMASLDGINLDEEIIVEIKCGYGAYEKLKDGFIPPYYMSQMQWAMWVSGAKLCYYFCYWDGFFLMKEVRPDHEFIERMFKAADEFYLEKQNANLKELGIEERDDEAFQEAVDAWKEINTTIRKIKDHMKTLESMEKDAREGVASLVVGRGARGFGVEIKKRSKVGSIDYSSIPELAGLDLEKYRKPRSFWWEVAELKVDATSVE